jgi:hypothetical protein
MSIEGKPEILCKYVLLVVLFARLNERHKEEFPPMFPEGFHRMTMDELRKRCVDDFPKSSRRGMIMEGLERMIAKLVSTGLDDCELWIDGSFLTLKNEPDDVDFVLLAPAKFYDQGTEEQIELLDQLEDEHKKLIFRQQYHCDSHAFAIYPETSINNVLGIALRRIWQNNFGKALISGEPKGIAVFAVAQPHTELPQKEAV